MNMICIHFGSSSSSTSPSSPSSSSSSTPASSSVTMATRGPAASEQHAGRVHLDAKRGEEGGLQQSPRPPGAVLHAQPAGLRAVLWKDSDHLHAGIQYMYWLSLHGPSPQYLTDLLHPKTRSRSLRSSDKDLLAIPKCNFWV